MGTGVVGAGEIAGSQAAFADGPTTVSQTFGYTGATDTFTVPEGITQITVTMTGGQGGQGGTDSSGPSPAGGYQGRVNGTMTVTPGQELTIAAGSGGQGGSAGAGYNSPDYFEVGAAVGGSNPISGYGGGNGGVAGYDGSSGYGGAGGAASVIVTGSTTIVAGGSGGAGGSGQFPPTIGHVPYSTFTARPDTTSGTGRNGISVYTPCLSTPGDRCDGGGGGAGGGGVQGGEQGDVQFGSGDSNEWYGYGGYPGQNTTGAVSGLSGSYGYYPDNSGDGSITISYTTGAPGAPTSVSGIAGSTSVALAWTAPSEVGQDAISDYVVQYALASSPTSWTTFDDGVSTDTSTTLTGLSNGTGYVFQVIPVNAAGSGTASSPTGTITPSGPPAAPVIGAISGQDGGLSVAFSAGASDSPILGYQYRLDGTGPWISTGSTLSPLVITGLTNGDQYAVEIRAVSAIGDGDPSSSVDATPQGAPGAPTITSVSPAAGGAVVSFTPGYSGGRAITDYDYQIDDGIWRSAGTSTSPVENISGLDSGTAYSVAIRARNSSGPGAASQTASFTTADVPGVPAVSITRGDTSLSIAYTPGNPGGSTITGYQYSTDGGSVWHTATTASPIVVGGLDNGTTYSVSVRALNTIGNGTASTPQDATPATVPGAPGIVGDTVAGSDLQLSADFTTPGTDGGSPITSYEYSTDAGATWRERGDSGTTASPLVISALSSDGTTPLENGVTYSVELRAVNAVGSGLASDVATGIAGTVPASPTITTVAAGSGSLQVGFTPGANGGAHVTAYEYRLSSGGWTSTGTLGNAFTITGLTNGTSYEVSVRATNSFGIGTDSAPVSGTPRSTPAQPTITIVIRGDQSLGVAVADADDGGSAITAWQYSTDGGTTWRSAGTATSPLTITTLSTNGTTQIANGTSYPITVRAVNAAGASVASATTSVGPSAVPDAPTVGLTAQNHAIQVAFTVPGDGGSPVSAIEYRLDGSTWVNAGTLSSPFTIASLTNGTPYAVEVRARNAIGSGTSSTPASATPLTVPYAPTSVAAAADTASTDVTWTAPAGDGGSAITSYTATAYTDADGTTTAGTSCTTATAACSITALNDGTTYYVSVVAQNVAGTSVASSPRAQVTPLDRPGAPTLSSLTPGNAFLTLDYSAGSEGTYPITGYQYQLNGGLWQATSSTTSPLSISGGLTNGTSYTVSLRAVSAAGAGTASDPLTATPFTFPDSPDPLTIVAAGADSSIVVSWAAPASNGSAISGYTATAFTAATAGSQAATCTTSGELTCTLTGLNNDTPYYVSLQALNDAGLSARSAPRVSATPAPLSGTVPTASTPVRAATGYTFDITNYSSSVTYGVEATDGATVEIDGSGHVTVTGLAPGASSTTTVTAGRAGYSTTSDSFSGTALDAGAVPTASPLVGTADGYTFSITNFDSSLAYDVQASNGATADIDGSGHVTVTGLAPGASSTTTVTASRTGYTTASDSFPGTALDAGLVPTASPLVRTADGYTFSITNFDSSITYDLRSTNGAIVDVDVFGHVTVTGLAPGASSTTTVTASREGYSTTSAPVAGTALAAGTVPTASTPVPAADGYTFTITNYSSSVTYDLQATNGATVKIDGSGHVTVTGLAPGTSSTTTVTATRAGYTPATAPVPGTALTIVFSPGDFTGDHKTDVLAVRPNGGLYLFRGNGLGGFTGSPARIGAGWGIFTKILSTGDFTGDNKADILGIRTNGDLYLYRGNGLGGFTTGIGVKIGSGWAGTTKVFSTGDFTGDHKTDILGIRTNGDLYLYRGNGLGGFTGSATRVGAGWAPFTRVLSPGDFTGDHRTDVLATLPNGYLYLYRGNGLGGFTGTGTRISVGWDTFTVFPG